MDTPCTTLTIATELRHRLRPLALVIALLISLTFPTSYFLFMQKNERQLAHEYAVELAKDLESIPGLDPTLWSFQEPTFRTFWAQFLLTHTPIETIHILTADGESIPAVQYPARAGSGWRLPVHVQESAPIHFGNGTRAAVTVVLPFVQQAWMTMVYFLVAASLGGGLAYITYRSPLRIVSRLEMDNARLAKAQQAGQRHLDAVRTNAEAFVRELDLASLLQQIIRRTAALLDTEQGAIWLWNEAEQAFQPRSWHGYGSWIAAVRQPLGTGLAGTVGLQRTGLIVNDRTASRDVDPAFRDHATITAAIAEPLQVGDQILGVIALTTGNADRHFTSEDATVLQVFAAQVAVAVVKAELYEGSVRRQAELEALLRASHSVMSGLDLEEILERILTEAAAMARVEHVRVMLVDPAAQVLRTAGVRGGLVTRGYTLPMHEGLTGDVLRTGAPVSCANVQGTEGMLVERYKECGIQTYLGLPIKIDQRVLGVLIFNTSEPRHYRDEELAYLGAFAGQAAVALKNAQLYAAANEQTQRLEALFRSTSLVLSGLDRDTVLDHILAEASKISGVPHIRITLYDPTTHTLQIVRVKGGLCEPGHTYPAVGFAKRNVLENQTVYVPDVDHCPAAHFYERYKALGIKTFLGIPIRTANKPIGVLIFNTLINRTYTPEEITYLTTFADQAAIALENAQLHTRSVRRQHEVEALLDSTRSLMSGLDLQGILDQIVEQAAKITGAPHVKVLLVDREANGLRVGAIRGFEHGPGDLLPLDRGASATVVHTGQMLYDGDHQANPNNLFADLDTLHQLVTYLGLPIKIQEQVLGVLTFNTTRPHTYPPEELAYLSAFADQAAVAIENARLYSEIQQHARALEQRVAERTAELGQANRDLEAASRHKSEFLANMSHELRTPLNSILGFAQLLLEQTQSLLTPKQRRYLTHVRDSGQHLLQLINDILDISKVEAGKFVLQPETLRVGETLEDILVIARGLAHKKGQSVTLELAPDLPPIQADPVRFKQILFNLLSNAVKFTPPSGQVTVEARCSTTTLGAPNGHVEIAVRDTGIGIRPEDLGRLFQEFVQLETTQAQRHEGTGLGLALTKRLVELHGGQIHVTSDGTGHGSTFTLVFPSDPPSPVSPGDSAVLRAGGALGSPPPEGRG